MILGIPAGLCIQMALFPWVSDSKTTTGFCSLLGVPFLSYVLLKMTVGMSRGVLGAM